MNPDTFDIFFAFIEGQVPLYWHYDNKKAKTYEGYLKTFNQSNFYCYPDHIGKVMH